MLIVIAKKITFSHIKKKYRFTIKKLYCVHMYIMYSLQLCCQTRGMYSLQLCYQASGTCMSMSMLLMDHALCWRPSTHLRGWMHSKRMFGSDVQCQWITRQTTLPSWKKMIKQCSPCTRIKRTKIVVIDWSWKFSTTSGLL